MSFVQIISRTININCVDGAIKWFVNEKWRYIAIRIKI